MKKEILDILIDNREGGMRTIATGLGLKTLIEEFIPEKATDKILELFKERLRDILNNELSWDEYLARKHFKDFDAICKLKDREIKKVIRAIK